MGETVTFTDATSRGKTPYTYAWDFDNDAVVDSTDTNPTHSYGAAATYTVKLTVTDTLGNLGSNTTSVNVYLLGDANASESVKTVLTSPTWSTSSWRTPGTTTRPTEIPTKAARLTLWT